MPAAQLFSAGLLPFVPGDLIKAALASLVFPNAWRLVHQRTGIDA
jgi:biotin transporter BioY